MIDGIEHITPFADTTMPSIQKSPIKMLNSMGPGQIGRKKRSLDTAIAALYGGTDAQCNVDAYSNTEHGQMDMATGAETLEPGELNGVVTPEKAQGNGLGGLEPPKVNRLSFADMAHLHGAERREMAPEDVDKNADAKTHTDTSENAQDNEHNHSEEPQVIIPKEFNGAEEKIEADRSKLPCIFYSDIENQENKKPYDICEKEEFGAEQNIHLTQKSDTFVERKIEDVSPVYETPQKTAETKLAEVNSPLVNGHANADVTPPAQAQLPMVQQPQPATQAMASLNHAEPMGEPEAVCPECRKVFKRKVYLQRHMEREHWSTAKVFRCEDCGYETKHQSNLSVHRRTHTGERPYHCGACGQRYTQGHLLKSHIRSRHNGNMVYYKLDKKGDGTRTRGRRSLCVEDQMQHMEMPPIKQPKIENLLSAMAQGGNSLHNNPNFTGLLMNTTIGLMGSPFLHSPKMLPFLGAGAGIGGNMQNGASQLLGANSFLAPQPSLPMLPPGFGLLNGHGIRGPSQQPLGSVMGEKSPEHPGPKVEDIVMPQDLSVKKGDEKDDSTDSSDSDSEAKIPRLVGNGPIIIQPAHGDRKKHDVMLRDGVSPNNIDSADDLSSTGTQSPKSCGEGCDCKHSNQLQNLRKNVVRMLSILTPDLNIDNGINYESDQVDQLLHEVIYSNVDDEMKK